MIEVSPDIQFFIFGDNGVLFHPAVYRLWVLNAVAATVWCLLPEYHDEDDLQVQLASRFGIDKRQAANDIAGCLDYFKRKGLLQGGQPGESEQVNLLDIQLEDVDWQEPEVWAYESFLHVPGATVRFTSQNLQLGELFMSVLHHLEAEDV